MAAAVFVASLIASPYFAWRGAWGYFRAVYGLAWAIIVGALLFVLGGSHGTHGSPDYMIAWGLVFMLPFMAGAAVLAGLASWGVGFIGARHRGDDGDGE